MKQIQNTKSNAGPLILILDIVDLNWIIRRDEMNEDITNEAKMWVNEWMNVAANGIREVISNFRLFDWAGKKGEKK